MRGPRDLRWCNALLENVTRLKASTNWTRDAIVFEKNYTVWCTEPVSYKAAMHKQQVTSINTRWWITGCSRQAKSKQRTSSMY